MKYKLLIFFSLIIISCKDKEKSSVETNNIKLEDTLQDSSNSKSNKVYIPVEYDCKCPENKFTSVKADTVFTLTNNRQIALCGYRNNDNTFSEFILSDCDEKTVINFWDALTVCDVRTDNDTLMVKKIIQLPVGKQKAFEPIVWTIEKLYFDEGEIKRSLIINPEFPKYTTQETDLIIKEYETQKLEKNENSIKLAYYLFTAAISGSETAKQYFYEFPQKVKLPDGAYSEEYNDLKNRMQEFENLKSAKTKQY